MPIWWFDEQYGKKDLLLGVFNDFRKKVYIGSKIYIKFDTINNI
jgi:hypothetical protein